MFTFHDPTPALDVHLFPKKHFHFKHPQPIPRASKADGMIFRNPFIRERVYVFRKPVMKMTMAEKTFTFSPPSPAIPVNRVDDDGGKKFVFHTPTPVSPHKKKRKDDF